MALQFRRDIASDDDGDIVVNDRGDIEMAESPESLRHAIKMMMATDYGEITFDENFGSNLGSLIGEHSFEWAKSKAIDYIRRGILYQGLASLGDINVEIYKIDIGKMLVYLTIKCQFLLSTGEMDSTPAYTIKFIFPFKESELQEITDD